MSNLNVNGRKASIVRLHAPTQLTGYGAVGPLVETDKPKAQNKIELTVTDLGVLFQCNRLAPVLLPWTNIISVQLIEDKATVVGKIELAAKA